MSLYLLSLYLIPGTEAVGIAPKKTARTAHVALQQMVAAVAIQLGHSQPTLKSG